MDLLFDVIGIGGVVLILAAYFLLQRDKVSSHDLSYLYLNLVGAVCVIISLLHTWNLAAFMIETAWVLISLYGIVKALRNK